MLRCSVAFPQPTLVSVSIDPHLTSSQATDAWELLSSMLSAARDTLRADHSLPPEQRQAAEDALESVRGHVTAARLLTKHGLTTAVWCGRLRQMTAGPWRGAI